MTPKKKAKELVDKYKFYLGNEKENINEAKDLALIAIDEIINYCCGDDVLFLHKVKLEIEKL